MYPIYSDLKKKRLKIPLLSLSLSLLLLLLLLLLFLLLLFLLFSHEIRTTLTANINPVISLILPSNVAYIPSQSGNSRSSMFVTVVVNLWVLMDPLWSVGLFSNLERGVSGFSFGAV